MPVVQDVNSQPPTLAAILAACCHTPHPDRLLTLWNHKSKETPSTGCLGLGVLSQQIEK